MRFHRLKYKHFVSVTGVYHVVYTAEVSAWVAYRSDGGLRRLSAQVWKTAEAGFNECRKFERSLSDGEESSS